MADLLRNSNKRHQHEISEEPEAKKREPIGGEVNATDTESITNICNELIERIFDFLDLQSLLNVAGTCKRLQIAASAMYGQKFGRCTTNLCPANAYGDRLPKQGIRLFNNNGVEVFGRTALPFLRCFGGHISGLVVNALYKGNVIRYINQYCADTLTTLTIRNFDTESFTIESCPKPFKMVEEVDVDPLSKQFSNFAYWFPKMRILHFSTTRFDFDISSAVFPHLEELMCGAALGSYSEKRRMESFVRANQQVRSLDITVKKPLFSDLLKMISGHTMISNLEVKYPLENSKHVKRVQLLRFAKQHRMLVRLNFLSFLLKADDAVALIRRLNSLKFFRFGIKNRAEYNNLVNQLQHEIGFMFQARLTEGGFVPFVSLVFNR